MALEIVPFTFSAGETKRYERAGRYVEVIEATYPLDVILYDANGGAVDFARNVEAGIYSERPFAAVEIKSTAAQTVKVLVTDGRAGSRRQPGVVQVVDGGRARTMANQAFLGYIGIGVTASGAALLLLNPVGSGKRCIVRALRVTSSVAGIVGLGFHNAALAAGPFDPANKNAGSAASSTKLYREDRAAAPAVTFESVQVAANQLLQIALQEPIVLDPGEGLFAFQAGVLTLTFATEFVEEGIT